MQSTIQKWGNSQGIRLPKHILETAKLQENDVVEIEANNEDGIIIIRPSKKKHKTLAERLKGYNGDCKSTEWDTGKPTGNEVW